MRQVAWVLIALAGTAVAVAAGVVTGRAIWAQPETTVAIKLSAPLPDLYIADDKLDLGEVWESNDAVLTVPISNRTDKPIEILDFESSCDCGEISPRKLTVPANGTAEVTVKMDLTRRGSHQLGMVRRKFSIAFRPVIAGNRKLDSLEFTWIVRSGITLNHREIHFGELSSREPSPSKRILQITSHTEIRDIQFYSASDRIEVSLREVSVGNWELAIRSVKPLAPGHWEAEIAIEWLQSDFFRGRSKVAVSGRNVAVAGAVK